MKNVAVMGYGTVGSGVVEVLMTNKDAIAKKVGEELNVKYVLDLRDVPGDPVQEIITHNFDDILNDEEVTVVAEVMGGIEPAYTFTKKCLLAGKSVCTSNKALVEKHGAELLAIAKEKNVNYLFEASVGGGIPIIRPISQCLAANEICEIAGILNGTTNFILTKMIAEGMAFEDALKLAQDKGYAEKDPTADVEGFDALRKICILASLCFGTHVYPDGIYSEGISKITLEDVAFAESYDAVIKLIARAKKLSENKITVMVTPCFVKNSSMLSGVSGVFNACLVRGDMTGDVLMYGKGAGKLATASAVVGDVIDSAANDKERKFFGWADEKKDFVASYLENETAFYVRALDADKSEIENTFGTVQYLKRDNQAENEIAFVTPAIREKEARNAIEKLPIDVKSILRVLDY